MISVDVGVEEYTQSYSALCTYPYFSRSCLFAALILQVSRQVTVPSELCVLFCVWGCAVTFSICISRASVFWSMGYLRVVSLCCLQCIVCLPYLISLVFTGLCLTGLSGMTLVGDSVPAFVQSWVVPDPLSNL